MSLFTLLLTRFLCFLTLSLTKKKTNKRKRRLSSSSNAQKSTQKNLTHKISFPNHHRKATTLRLPPSPTVSTNHRPSSSSIPKPNHQNNHSPSIFSFHHCKPNRHRRFTSPSNRDTHLTQHLLRSSNFQIHKLGIATNLRTVFVVSKPASLKSPFTVVLLVPPTTRNHLRFRSTVYLSLFMVITTITFTNTLSTRLSLICNHKRLNISLQPRNHALSCRRC